MATFIIVDTNNLFFRSKFSVRGDLNTKVGMSFHVMLMSLRKMWNTYNGDHVIFATEGKSWRYDYDAKYKLNRKIDRLAKTELELEEDAIFMEALNDFISFIDSKTNCTLVKAPNAEADDVIARWVQTHPNDNHIIISSDSDFVQLVAENVMIHDGVNERTLKHDGVYDSKGVKLEFTIDSSGKVKTGKPNPEFIAPDDWQEFALFTKCIRGDKSDNIFSAYPGARFKGTSKRAGIVEAFEDRINKGFDYNNFMLQKWTDHEDQEHRVIERYEANRLLIDLTMQPEIVKAHVDEVIANALQKPVNSGVGIHFMKFCNRWDLANISKYPTDFANILNKKYTANL